MGGYDHWPTGRGGFWSVDGSIGCFVNREDHLSVVSQVHCGDLTAAWEKMRQSLEVIVMKESPIWESTKECFSENDEIMHTVMPGVQPPGA